MGIVLPLDKYELERYSRQLPLIGVERQEKLKSSTVLIVGAGGLGSVISVYLTYIGVGRVIIVDDGIVELNNLNRQIIYGDRDVNEPKAVVACRKLREANPRVVIDCYGERFDERSGDRLVKEADVVIDALDNWRTRLILNSLCIRNGKPFIHGGVEGWHGQVTTIIPGQTPCLNCLFVGRKVVDRESAIPVIAFTPGIIGLIEATEAVKLLIQSGELLTNKLLLVDLYTMEFKTVNISRNPKCPVCSRA